MPWSAEEMLDGHVKEWTVLLTVASRKKKKNNNKKDWQKISAELSMSAR